MDSNGITPVMPMGGDGLGGSNSFFWVFALLLLMSGGFGGFGWGGNNNGVNTLNADMQRGFDAQNSMSQARDILSAVTNGTSQTIAASTANATNAISAIKDGNAALIREFGTVESALTALSGKQQECCCDVKGLIQSTSAITDAAIAASKYETAMQLAGMEQRITSKMDQNEITSLRDQLNALQIQSATSNVVRYPNSWAFNGGYFPPMQCGCGNI